MIENMSSVITTVGDDWPKTLFIFEFDILRNIFESIDVWSFVCSVHEQLISIKSDCTAIGVQSEKSYKTTRGIRTVKSYKKAKGVRKK
jgi:hypothetical protein